MNNLLPHHFASVSLRQVWPQKQVREPLFVRMIDSLKKTSSCNASKPIPIQTVIESLEYDPTSPSGLKWKNRPMTHFDSNREWKRWNGRFAKTTAGAIWNGKYWRIMVSGVIYRVHRLVWCLIHGADPGTKILDHINGNGLDNRIENLRLANHSQNGSNQKKTHRNTSGTVGVVWHKSSKKWQAQIEVHQKNIYLGLFSSKADACAARKAAESRYFGSFSYDISQQLSVNHP
jgi:hypothetical protein